MIPVVLRIIISVDDGAIGFMKTVVLKNVYGGSNMTFLGEFQCPHEV